MCRQPVEPVEEGEKRQADNREARKRKIDKRQAAQSVIPEEKPPIVEPIRQPARSDRPEEIEQAHQRKEAASFYGDDPEVAAQRHEMGLDHPVGARAANEEGKKQKPKDGHLHSFFQHRYGYREKRPDGRMVL